MPSLVRWDVGAGAAGIPVVNASVAAPAVLIKFRRVCRVLSVFMRPLDYHLPCDLPTPQISMGIRTESFYDPPMDALLNLLRTNAALAPAQLAPMLNQSPEEIAARIKQYENEGVILGYRTILNEEKLGVERVRAVIEVKITPEREGGFNRLAERIAKYEEVTSCYLMSGGYDLLVLIEGQNLREVASFVSEKLATIQGVLSTSTHFMLKPYKEHGVLMAAERNEDRLAISP